MMRERLRALTDPRVPHGRKPKSVRLRAPPAPPVVGETEYKLLNASRTASGDQYYEYPPLHPSLCSVTHARCARTTLQSTEYSGAVGASSRCTPHAALPTVLSSACE